MQSFFSQPIHLAPPKQKAVEKPANIAVRDLTVCYREIEALSRIHLQVRPGTLTGIIGPNGAGKSTLVKAMLGLIPATTGTVRYGEQPLTDFLDRVAYVPQRSQIDWTFPATVWDVVIMGRTRKTGWLRRYSTVSRRIAKEALERVGMAAFAQRRIGDLSGGQQQRVFLARSLAQEANVFCFDEPFTGVDRKTEVILFEIFRELADAGNTVLVVNHDLGESITRFDELILLNRELIASGDRRFVMTPENMYRAYGGQIQFFSDAA